MMGDRPVFVTGLPRTGKTPLRTILGQHPRLSLTRKTRLWTRFYGRFGDLRDAKSLDRCLQELMLDPDVRRLEPDEEAVRSEFARWPATYPHLFGVLYSQHARRQGKERWGEQVGFLESHAAAIFGTWPEASIIHMVRRPDMWIGTTRALSRPGRVSRELEKWRESSVNAIANQQQHPTGYLLVQYEELASAPGATLSAVLSFIGEEATAEMDGSIAQKVSSAALETEAVPRSGRFERATRPILSLLGYDDQHRRGHSRSALPSPSAGEGRR